MEVFYNQVQKGTVFLNETHELKKEDQVCGTGQLQYEMLDKELTYEEFSYETMRTSDNTAALADGYDNYTSTKDVGRVLKAICHGKQ